MIIFYLKSRIICVSASHSFCIFLSLRIIIEPAFVNLYFFQGWCISSSSGCWYRDTVWVEGLCLSSLVSCISRILVLRSMVLGVWLLLLGSPVVLLLVLVITVVHGPALLRSVVLRIVYMGDVLCNNVLRLLGAVLVGYLGPVVYQKLLTEPCLFPHPSLLLRRIYNGNDENTTETTAKAGEKAA